MKKFLVGSVGLLIFFCSSVFAESKTIYLGKDFEIEIQDDGTRIERMHLFVGDTKVATAETTRREGEEPIRRMIYHHEDHLTGANVDTDENGQVVQLSDYYPYGDSRIDEHGEDYHNDYQFTGKERDEETGLSYYGARYYDSSMGRFISRDPWEGDLRDPQSLNKYSYVKNNPLKYTDPSGEAAFLITGLSGDSRDMKNIKQQVDNFTQAHKMNPIDIQIFKHYQDKKVINEISKVHESDPTEPIVIAGHSMGGASAIRIAEELGRKDIAVDKLIQMDSVDFFQGPRMLPSNVRRGINFYQRDNLPFGVKNIEGAFNMQITNTKHTTIDQNPTVVNAIKGSIIEAHSKRQKNSKEETGTTDRNDLNTPKKRK